MKTDRIDIATIDDVQLTQQTQTLISDLVHQVGRLSKGGVLPELMDAEMYADVGNPQEHITTMTKKAQSAREKSVEYSKMPPIKWYSLNKTSKRNDREDAKSAIISDIIAAVDGNALATKCLFNQLINLSTYSKGLLAIGLMGIASNRIVVREIKARLEEASQDEIDSLARQELETVMQELIHQRDLEDKIDTKADKTLTYTKTEVDTFLLKKQDTINDIDTIRNNAIKGSTALQPSDISEWAKKEEKPSYSAEEVGALPSSTFIPTKVSDLENDEGFLTEHQDISMKADLTTVEQSLGQKVDETTYRKTIEELNHELATNKKITITSLVIGGLSFIGMVALIAKFVFFAM